MRKDFTVVLSLSGSAVDDRDKQLYENYSCRSPRNYTGYCNPKVEALIDRQSAESDPAKRKELVWRVERKLIEDGCARSSSLCARRPAGSPRSRA
jgi:peptide/nickel transport system substrate-binding protein